MLLVSATSVNLAILANRNAVKKSMCASPSIEIGILKEKGIGHAQEVVHRMYRKS